MNPPDGRFFFLNLRIFFLNLRIVDLMGERSCCEPLRSCSRFLEVCAKRLCKFELVEKLISGRGLIRITNVWFLSIDMIILGIILV